MYYHRTDRDEGIRYLAEKFPACFAEDPGRRRPLKHNIILDLEKERVLNHEALVQILDWYMSHFVYRHGIIAGADRIDLNGRKVGTVTPTEQAEARAWITARKKEMAERQNGWARTTRIMNGSAGNGGGKPAGAVSTAPTATVPSAPTTHPMLADLQTTLVLASSFLTDEQYTPMRPALLTAALKQIVCKAENLLQSTNGGDNA